MHILHEKDRDILIEQSHGIKSAMYYLGRAIIDRDTLIKQSLNCEIS